MTAARRAETDRDALRLSGPPFSFQKRSGLIKIRGIELRKLDQSAIVVERHMAVPESGQTVLAQLSQDAIDVHRAQTQGVGEG